MRSPGNSYLIQKEFRQRIRPRDIALLFVSFVSTTLIGVYHLNLRDNL